ncbi:hypothetical protein CRUP_003645, partial [Coryphaenoides rupestris]
YRFMDMFPDTASVREIQRTLDDIIQQGVRNITRLIRASDPGSPGGGGEAAGAPGSQSKGRANYIRLRHKAEDMLAKQHSLSSRLVKDGLLTADLLRQLQSEWADATQKKNKKK